MGGGLFGTPLALNIKCIIFSGFVIATYLLPHPKNQPHNLIIMFLLATSAYIGLAWYDVIYDCNDRLQPTLFGYMSKSFKPREYQQKYDKLPIKTKKIIRNFDIFILIIILITFVYPFIVKSR